MRDGHIHTRFCPHGTKDSIEAYVNQALLLGFSEITFTEHAPLPEGFTDPTPMQDSAMRYGDLDEYFAEIDFAKRKYSEEIKIHTGFEVDFIEGYEEGTRTFLDQYGHHIDDSILSVHFLKNPEGKYDCLDYSPDTFGLMAEKFGSTEQLHIHYYRTVLKSIQSDLGSFKPKRIGHITLVNKFRLKYPVKERFSDEINEILSAMSKGGYELDYNGAGTAKPLCREPYPPDWVIQQAKTFNIPLVYGSDAHQVKELGQGLDQIKQKK